ncbi:MAG: phosphoribosyltransferase [Gemmatimonadetes bacterium]|nr:phosphoribosyltransferase [Gemmatimonadota bacterium]
MSFAPAFQDRHAAGVRLAEALSLHAAQRDVVVLGMARGGVAVAAPVAKALAAPLETFVGRKLGVPGLEEVAFGAIAEGGATPILDDVHDYIGLPRRVVSAVLEHERAEMARRVGCYREGRALPTLAGKTVLVVDDGLASGATLTAAGRALRRQRPARLIAAVPVASTEGVQQVASMFDDVVAIVKPDAFGTVSDWYEDYDAVTDAEVCTLLGRRALGAGIAASPSPAGAETDVSIPTGETGPTLAMAGDLGVPAGARPPHGLVIFAHGGGSSRASYRNRYLAARLRLTGWATLRVDLLGEHERAADDGGAMRFDIDRITRRLSRATRWCLDARVAGVGRLVLFGASTGAAAAVGVAAMWRSHVAAVIVRGGRIDLADHLLPQVDVPALLIVGKNDTATLQLTRAGARRLRGPVSVEVVRGAGHTFEEDGALGIVGEIATAWLTRLRRRDAIRRLWTVSSHWPATLRARIVARTIA